MEENFCEKAHQHLDMSKKDDSKALILWNLVRISTNEKCDNCTFYDINEGWYSCILFGQKSRIKQKRIQQCIALFGKE